MTSDEIAGLRHSLGLTQGEMATHIGMGLRAYHDIEAGVSKVRPVHVAAAERAALAIAVERGNPMLAPPAVRRQALELARLMTGS